MSAASDIAHALGGARRSGHGYMAKCPSHDDRTPSLWLVDGDDGRVHVHCHAGCDRRNVEYALRRLGLRRDHPYAGDVAIHDVARHERRAAELKAQIDSALGLWRECQPSIGTPVETYLASRRIDLRSLPPAAQTDLRFHPNCPHPEGGRFPAMVAAIRHLEHGFVAIHRTFIDPRGAGKAKIDCDRAGLGPVGGGAFRLAGHRVGEPLVIAEGIETAASVFVATGYPTWAALSEGGMRSVVLPEDASEVLIAGDNDINGVGQRAAEDAAERFRAEGRTVAIVMPPIAGHDFNTILCGAIPRPSREAPNAG